MQGMQILQGMPILGFFDESLATMQRKFILYHENILGCQRNNPRGNVLPSLRSGGLFYPRCARVKQLPPFSSIGKNNFPPLVFLRLPKFFHNTTHFSGRKCWTFEMSKLYHLVFCQNEPKTKYFPLKMKIFIHGLFRN